VCLCYFLEVGNFELCKICDEKACFGIENENQHKNSLLSCNEKLINLAVAIYSEVSSVGYALNWFLPVLCASR